MTTRDLIEKLQAIEAEHGVLEVWQYHFKGGIAPARFNDAVKFIRHKRKRESNVYVWQSWDKPEEKEKKVVVL